MVENKDAYCIIPESDSRSVTKFLIRDVYVLKYGEVHLDWTLNEKVDIYYSTSEC